MWEKLSTHWYSPWTGTFIRHFLYGSSVRAADGDVKFIFEQFVLVWLGHARLSREAINEKTNRPLDVNDVKTICCSVTPSLLAWCRLCSSTFSFSFICAQQKGDFNRLKAWRSVLLQSICTPLTNGIDMQEKQLWNQWMNESLTVTAKTERSDPVLYGSEDV